MGATDSTGSAWFASKWAAYAENVLWKGGGTSLLLTFEAEPELVLRRSVESINREDEESVLRLHLLVEEVIVRD